MSLFISFEGVEGCGKSTQAEILNRRLSDSNLSVVMVKEPGGTPVGRVVEEVLKQRIDIPVSPVTELLLFAASRAQLVCEVIRPALDRKQIVVCDRHAESTLAYQGYGRGLDLKTIETVNMIATSGLRPDLIVLLDMDVQEGLRRKGSPVARDRFEEEEIPFHLRVRQGYLEMAITEPERWLVIDATSSRDAISELIWERVQQNLSDD